MSLGSVVYEYTVGWFCIVILHFCILHFNNTAHAAVTLSHTHLGEGKNG